MVYESLEDMRISLKSMFCIDQKDYGNICSGQIRFHCKDSNDRFKVYGFEIIFDRTDDTFSISIYYNIFGCSFEENFCIEFENLSSIDESLSKIFEVLWKYKPCVECLNLIPSEQHLCKDCQCGKLMWDFAVDNRYVSEYEKCAICLENAYCFQLRCRHRFHRSCFIHLHDKEWYNDTTTILCPVCRAEITPTDKRIFFFYEE